MIFVKDKGASSEILKDGFQLNLTEIELWLLKKQIINAEQKLVSYKDVLQWYRGGAETYIASFEIEIIVDSNILQKDIILKALVTLTPEISLKNWEKRRKILSDNNIPVSNWYYWGDGLILEEKYFHFKPDLDHLSKLLLIAVALDKLGFSTLHFTSALMVNVKNEIVFVDFGFDLGDPSKNYTVTALSHIVELFPEQKYEVETLIATLAN